jgi:hypothetical protein
MSKVKGYQVTVSGVQAGSEQSCSLSIQNNLQEEEIKDATNPLSPPQEKVSAQWSIQQTCKLDTAAAVKTLIQAACGISTVAVSMAAAGATFSGNAFVSDLTIQAPNRNIITSQATYSGSGALAKATN